MILLKEEFSKQQAQKIFTDLLNEFEDCWDLDLVFDRSKIDSKLHYLNSNNRKVLGECKRYRVKRYYSDDEDYDIGQYDEDDYYFDQWYEIYLNPNCLKFEEDAIKIIKETLAHELCHTMPDCMNHGSQFRKNGDLIYRKLGYFIDEKADLDATKYFNSFLPDHPYMVQCEKCGGKRYQDRLSDIIKNPAKYQCGRCRGDLNSYKLNKSTGEYELYHSYNDAPDYKYYVACEDPECGYFEGFKTKDSLFKKLLNAMQSGHSLQCPKCRRSNLYLYDNGSKWSTAKYNYK